MSHFYASIQGNRGSVSRTGSENSGIHGHIRGWRTGVRVSCHHDDDSDKDVCRIYRTSGSNGYESDEHIATVSKDDVDLDMDVVKSSVGTDLFSGRSELIVGMDNLFDTYNEELADELDKPSNLRDEAEVEELQRRMDILREATEQLEGPQAIR